MKNKKHATLYDPCPDSDLIVPEFLTAAGITGHIFKGANFPCMLFAVEHFLRLTLFQQRHLDFLGTYVSQLLLDCEERLAN